MIPDLPSVPRGTQPLLSAPPDLSFLGIGRRSSKGKWKLQGVPFSVLALSAGHGGAAWGSWKGWAQPWGRQRGLQGHWTPGLGTLIFRQVLAVGIWPDAETGSWFHFVTDLPGQPAATASNWVMP